MTVTAKVIYIKVEREIWRDLFYFFKLGIPYVRHTQKDINIKILFTQTRQHIQ